MVRNLTLLVAFIGLSAHAFAVNPPVIPSDEETALYGITFDNSTALSPEAILSNNSKEFSKKYGVKMGLKEKVAYGFARRHLKRAEKQGKDLDEALAKASEGGGWFNAWGFVLGLLLGLIGWLIAVIFWPKGSGAGKSAILGFLVALVIVGIIVLIV